MDDKLSLKRLWLRHMTPYKLEVTINISEMAEARVVRFCIKVGYIKSYQRDDI